MRIAIVTTSFPLTDDMTSGIFISRLACKLASNVDISVITPCPDSTVKAKADCGTRVNCFHYAPRRWQLLAHQPGGIPVALRNNRGLLLLLPCMLTSMLFACIRSGRHADLMHANWSLNGVIAGIAGRLTGTPVVTTLRGSDIERLEHSSISRLLLKWCLKLSHRVVTVSDAINSQVCEMFPHSLDKVSTIPNGVGDEFLNVPEYSTNNSNTLTITSIGSLIPRKCMDTLIRAAGQIPHNKHLHLQVIGAGAELEKLQAVARKVASKGLTVTFPGSISPDEIPDRLASTDIFVLASQFEGRPNVILEAMAAGRPIIASDINGVRELVTHEETGLLFTCGDQASLEKQLGRLCSDGELREQLGCAARNFIMESRLTWDNCAENYSALYASCFKHRHNAPVSPE